MHDRTVKFLPFTLQIMSLSLGVTSLVAAFIIKGSPTSPGKTVKSAPRIKLLKVLTSSQFILLYTMGLFSIFMGYYILNIYKMFGAAHHSAISDDNYLTTVGVFASLIGTMRFFWSGLLDFKWASFKLIYAILLVIQIILGLTFEWAAAYGRITFAVWVSTIIFCEGGHFTLLPAIYRKCFGEEGAIRAYGVGFSYTGVSSVLILVVVTFINGSGKSTEIEAFTPVIYMSVGLSAIALILLIVFFREEPISIHFEDDDYSATVNKILEKELISTTQKSNEVDQSQSDQSNV